MGAAVTGIQYFSENCVMDLKIFGISITEQLYLVLVYLLFIFIAVLSVYYHIFIKGAKQGTDTETKFA